MKSWKSVYCDEEGPLFHGFLLEMRGTLMYTLLLNRRADWVENLIEDRKLPSKNELTLLLEYTKNVILTGIRDCIQHWIPPITPGGRVPPTFAL